MEELQDRKKDYEVLSPGHDTAIAIMMSQKLWWPALGLHENRFVNCQAWSLGGHSLSPIDSGVGSHCLHLCAHY